MNLTALCIRRPVATYMVASIVLILGTISFLKIPVDLMPEITFPSVTISTTYDNVGPLESETLISEPVEKAVSSVEGVEKVTSVSVEGRSQVRVSFSWGTDLEGAVSDIRSKIDRIRDDLPEDAEAPVISNYDVNASPVMFIGVSGQMNPVALRRLVEDEVQYRLERVPGVASADIRGGLEREIHVDLSLDKLKALVRTVSLPVVAIGGIHQGNVREVLETGAAAVAMISALTGAPDVIQATRQIKEVAKPLQDRSDSI